MADKTAEPQRAAFNGNRRVPPPVNEPVRTYAPGSPERAELKARLTAMAGEPIEIPLVIGGREVRTGRTAQTVMPHDHGHVLADWHKASAEHVDFPHEPRVVFGGPRLLPAKPCHHLYQEFDLVLEPIDRIEIGRRVHRLLHHPCDGSTTACRW